MTKPPPFFTQSRMSGRHLYLIAAVREVLEDDQVKAAQLLKEFSGWEGDEESSFHG